MLAVSRIESSLPIIIKSVDKMEAAVTDSVKNQNRIIPKVDEAINFIRTFEHEEHTK